MELTVSLELGPLRAQLTGEDREEIQKELVELINFIEQNEEIFDGYVPSGSESAEGAQQISTTENTTQGPASDSQDTSGDIPDRTGLDAAILNQYFDTDPLGDEPPYLNFDVDVLGESGSSRSEKQMRASLILFTLWKECLGIEMVTSSDLKDALRISGIDDSNLYNMYGFNDGEGDRYFRREGSGQNTEIELTLPGQREGYDQIRRTVERLESIDDE